MRSSTFDFRSLTARSAIALLLGALVLYFVLLEAGMRVVVPRISGGLLRLRNDYQATLALRPTTPSGSRTVLVVGNSLLLSGVVRSQLQNGLAPHYAVGVFPIEGTTFFDWYFGLRRFFSEGSRPAVVIVCMNLGQLISDSTHDATFAYSMMRGGDLVRVKRAAGLDMMTASDYFFAHISSWFGTRAHLRMGLLGRLMPGTDMLAAHFTRVDPERMTASRAVLERALQRLRQFQQLCNSYGASFIMLIPPTRYASDPAPAVALLAQEEGIPFLIPYQPAELPAAVFSDGFHLDRQGAELFTSRLGEELPGLLERRPD